MTIQEGCPRRNTSSAEQSQGQKVWSDTRSNVPNDSTDDGSIQKEQDKGSHEISQGKAASTALNALQLTLWLH